MCFIPKQQTDKFRLISLAPTALKLLERVINDRMQWWAESAGILPRKFFGFRRNKSCIDCLSMLHSELLASKAKTQTTGVVSLDLEGAYNSVNADILI